MKPWKKPYRPYAPRPLGKTLTDVETALPNLADKRRDQVPITREMLEQAIANSKRDYGYMMRGTLDVALASGAQPILGEGEDSVVHLLGWTDALGNVVTV